MAYINNSRSERSLEAINECICPKSMINTELKEEMVEYLENKFVNIDEKLEKVNMWLLGEEKVVKALGVDGDDVNLYLEEVCEALEERKADIIEFTKNVKIKDLKNNLDLDKSSEWHHTGAFYNATDHYDMIAVVLGLYFKELIK